MGLFSSIFKGFGKSEPKIVSGKNPGKGFASANKFNRARGGQAGGYGAWTFCNIMNAHSSAEEIVEEFALDTEEGGTTYGCDAYLQAYQEEWDSAAAEYNDLMGWFQDWIEADEEMMRELQGELDDLNSELDSLEDELQDLYDDLEWADDPLEAEEILDEIEVVQDEIAEVRDEIPEIESEIQFYDEEIYSLRDEAESYSIESDFLDYDEVEKKAFDYACDFINDNWLNQSSWIPSDILDWAYYDVSDHNI